MENPHPNPYTPNNNHTQSSSNNNNNGGGGGGGGVVKKIFKSNSIKSNKSMSMSDADSQYDSFHSPLRSPLRSPRSDDPIFKSPSDSNPNPNSKAIVAMDKYFSPLRSPRKPSSENLSLPPTPPPTAAPVAGRLKNDMFPPPPPPPMMVFNRAMTDGVQHGVPEKVDMRDRDEERGGDRRYRTTDNMLLSSKKELMVNKAALGFRVSEVILCLISFSVMAADKTQGWSGDSFDRYREYRFLVAVNVIGFVYSGFQAYDLAYYLVTAKHVISSHFRYFFDFAIDQVLAYLLMSASSASATRVDDWVSNWGKDEFTEMATASISVSFLAFLAFAVSSIICGYSLCNRESS